MICVDRLIPLPREKQIYWVVRAVKEGWAGNALCRAINESKSGVRRIKLPSAEDERRDKLSHCMNRLEQIDKELDELNIKSAQMLIRKAVNEIIDSEAIRRKQAA